jgi:hypothetical protein
MLSGLPHQTLSPLCVSMPCQRRLHPANQAYQLPAARGPPLPGSAETASSQLCAWLRPPGPHRMLG